MVHLDPSEIHVPILCSISACDAFEASEMSFGIFEVLVLQLKYAACRVRRPVLVEILLECHF